MLWRGLKTACYHSLIHIVHFVKDVDQCQSHNPFWCRFVYTICVVEIGVDGSIVVFMIFVCLFTPSLPRDGGTA